MYYSFKGLFLFIAILILIKVATPLIVNITTFKEKNYKLNLEIKKENLNNLTPFEFEKFCTWLLDDKSKYKKVLNTQTLNDNEVHIVLTLHNDEKIYVECKRFDKEKLSVGKEVCQRLVGAMVANKINEGVIITTGDINENALEYIQNLENNTNIKLTLVDTEGILALLDNKLESEENYKLEIII